MIMRQANQHDPPAIARIHVDSWRSTYATILADEVLTTLSYERREEQWRSAIADDGSQRIVCVADNGFRKLVGFAAGGPERSGQYGFQGELYALYILEHFQGQGIGRRLFATVAERLVRSGMNSMLAWVLAENPATGIYRRLGGKLEYSKEIIIGGASLEEPAYGWKDMQPLFSVPA